MWEPYSWEPVHYTGQDFRVTYGFAGDVEELNVHLGDEQWPFLVASGIAEVIISDEEMRAVPDRAKAEVKIKTGGRWHLMCTGYLTRRG